MGNYASQSDILTVVSRNQLIRLTDLDDEGTIHDATVTAAIAEAEADIDGYISRRRAVPVTPVPAKLLYLTIRWALYVLYRYRQSVSEDIETDHRRDVEWLEAYASGEGSLGDDADPGAVTSGDAEADYNDRIYTRDKLAGW